jgi:hypothetical protein
MMVARVIACAAILALVPAAAVQQDTERSMALAGVSLSLKAPQDAVLKELSARASLEQSKSNEWLIYSTEKPGARVWLGSVVFKKGKLAFAARSWGSPGNHPAKDFMKELGPGVSGCRFVIVQTLDQHSPVRITSLICGSRKLIFQVAKNEKQGLFNCEIETLGDPKGLLAKVDFWKPCHSPTP